MRSSLQLLVLSLAIITLSSCASKSKFIGLYNQHKSDADLALSIPRWLAMTAIPGEIKRDIKPLVKGMRQMKFLLDENSSKDFRNDFQTLSQESGYTPYATVTNEDLSLNILAKESQENIEELIVFGDGEDGTFLLGVTGKINKENFLRELENISKK